MSVSVFALQFQPLNNLLFPKGERLEAGGEDKKRRNILHPISSTNTTPFSSRWLLNIWRDQNTDGTPIGGETNKAIRWIYFPFSPSPHLSHVSNALREKAASCWSSNSAHMNCWFLQSYINITDSLVIPIRAACDNVKIV